MGDAATHEVSSPPRRNVLCANYTLAARRRGWGAKMANWRFQTQRKDVIPASGRFRDVFRGVDRWVPSGDSRTMKPVSSKLHKTWEEWCAVRPITERTMPVRIGVRFAIHDLWKNR